MFIRRKERIATYAYLFQEGVCVVKKDYALPAHPEIETVRNVEVIALMKSLHSRGFVRETYNWCYYYYYLENEGIEYLRGFLNLPEQVVPETLNAKAPRNTEFERDARGGDRGRGGFGRGRSDDGYRRDGGDRGGFGRGRRD